MKSGDARVALIGFPSVGKVIRATFFQFSGLNHFAAYFVFLGSLLIIFYIQPIVFVFFYRLKYLLRYTYHDELS